MVCYKYINGERYILADHNEAKKRAFNDDIQDSLNKMMGSCTAEEKLLKHSSFDDVKKEANDKKHPRFPKETI